MSYHVFLAEDKAMIRCNIRENSIWKNSEFQLCGDAANGEEALEKIRSLPVDILITDIRMPFMDGLKLSAILKEERPDIRIIILSGYSEFDYAKKAIQLGVTEYLMKPITPSSLLKSLQNAAAMIDKDRNIRQSLDQLDGILERKRELPIRKYLCGLCSGLMPKELILAEAKNLNLSFHASCYIGTVVDLSCYAGNDDFFLDITGELSPLLESPDSTLYFMENDSNLCLIFIGSDQLTLEQMVERTCYKLKDYFKRCIISIGESCHSITALWKSFFSAHAALSARQLTYSGEIIKASHSYEMNSDSIKYPDIQKELILNLLKFGSVEDISPTIGKLKESLSLTKISGIYFMYMWVELCLTVKNFLSEFSQQLPVVFDQYAYSIIFPTSGPVHMDFFLDTVAKLLTHALQYRNEYRDNRYGDIIEEAKLYIATHFSSPSLSLTEVAASLNISPAYFSSIFSHETGETFIEYLTTVRIDRARELLKNSTLRITDIAFEVGYHSTNHFGKMFKRVVKVSPREYRNQ